MTTLDLGVSTPLVDSRQWAKTLVSSRAWQRGAVGVAADGAVILLAAVAAHFLRFDTFYEAAPEIPLWLPVVVPVLWLGTLSLSGAYSWQHLQTGPVEFQRVLLASALFVGLIASVNYFAQYELSRAFFLLTLVIGVPALLAVRYGRRLFLKRLHARGVLRHPVVVAGDPTHIDEVASVIRREKWLGYELVGAVTSADIDETPHGLRVLGTVDEVIDLVQASGAQTVIFAEGSFPDSQHFKRMAWRFEDLSAQMIVAPALTDVSAGRLATRPVGGLPLVYVERPQALNASRWAKRCFDIVGSGLLLIIASFILLPVMIAIKLEDRGPIFFHQTRVGRRGQEFQCLKVRSMVVDAEARKAALTQQNEGAGVLFKMARDPRITRVGTFIRRFSIDELPQLWNVFRGDMSLVGPRPALPNEVAQYDRDAVRRLDVRPGLTGLWQVSGRSDLPWDETVRLDSYYVDNWSFLQDLSIMLRTARAVVSSRGAY